ncbi:MAG TPA: M1 family metallopeptidase [Segetibacter sp.]|nr:M1 family metallopeptidase [Segetibacter sp.]
MAKIFLIIYLFLLTDVLPAQNNYWQQNVNFTINVSLNDKDNTLDAFETIEYTNNSPDTLRFIWFHIWPNAYKNDRTAFSEQLLKDRRTEFYFSKPSQKGYINQLNFIVDGSNATIVNDSNNIDIIKVLLPGALAPGNKTIITTPFKVKLPYNFSRGGYVGNDYQVTQWFPKPAVYDRMGWHQMPYLDQGEFYSELGKFDVEITVPSAYVVAATGILQDAETLQQLKEKGHHTIEGQTKTWHYKQDSIHDFAWFASKDFIVKYDTAILPSKKIIDIFSYYKPPSKAWNKSTAFAKDGLKKYSNWIGEYPYTVATVVQGSENETSGGMEYPTITLITTEEGGQELDATIVHEVGHNWFYGALATNERTHPWMDEGMNTYYQKRYENDKYSSYSYLKNSAFSLKKRLPDDEEELLLETMAKINKDQPIETPSEDFTPINYALIAYYKTSRWMKKLEDVLGRELFDSSMHRYYREWKFKHPYPEDFKASIEKSTGRKLDSIFNLLNETGSIAATKKKTLNLPFFSIFGIQKSIII